MKAIVSPRALQSGSLKEAIDRGIPRQHIGKTLSGPAFLFLLSPGADNW